MKGVILMLKEEQHIKPEVEKRHPEERGPKENK